MRLFLTPLSHFSRKVVIVLEELELEYEREYVPDLLSADPADFGGNPVLRVPVLEDGDAWVVESDAIARYLVEKYDPKDRFVLMRMPPAQRNALAFLSSIMGAEVELLLSKRAGTPHDRFFARYEAVIEHCLAWVEQHAADLWPPEDFSYLDIALTCMADHLQHTGMFPEPNRYPWIQSRVARFAERPSVQSTSTAAMQELQWQLYPSQRPSN